MAAAPPAPRRPRPPASPPRAASRSLPRPPTRPTRCASCHATLTDAKLRTPAKEFAHSVHRDERIGCVGCHKGDPRDPTVGAHSQATGFDPHPTHAEVPQICGGCHSDAAFIRRINGRLPVGQARALQPEPARQAHRGRRHRRAGLLRRATASTTSCPRRRRCSPVNRANVAKLCSGCHADTERMAQVRHPRPTSSTSGRRACTARRSARATRTRRPAPAATAPTPRRRPTRRRSRARAGAATRRRCSSSSRARTRRGSASAGSPSASPATATTTSRRASALMVGTGPDATCMKCHGHDDKPRQVADDIAELLRGARERAAEARDAVARATRRGAPGGGRRATRSTRSRPRSCKVRGVVHTLDPARVQALRGRHRQRGRPRRSRSWSQRGARAQARAARLLRRAGARGPAPRDARAQGPPARPAPQTGWPMSAGGGAAGDAARRGGAASPSGSSPSSRLACVAARAASARSDRVEHDPAFCASCATTSRAAARARSRATGTPAGTPASRARTATRRPLATGLRLALADATSRARRPSPHGKATAADVQRAATRSGRPSGGSSPRPQGHREHREREGRRLPLVPRARRTHVDRAAREGLPDAATRTSTCTSRRRPGAETCLSCHSYAASPKNIAAADDRRLREVPRRPRATSLASAGGADVRPMKDVNEHALHGGVACQLCHNAHGIKPTPPQGQPVCATCHQFENFQVGNEQRTGPEEHRKCEGCHKPHAPARDGARRRCVDCHEKNAKGLLGRRRAPTKTTALKHKSCASCHVPHTWKAERSGCMQCHKERDAALPDAQPAASTRPAPTATTSTGRRRRAPSASSATPNTKGKHVALAPERHKDCTSCHNPHAPQARGHADVVREVPLDRGHAGRCATAPKGTRRTAASAATSRTTTRCPPPEHLRQVPRATRRRSLRPPGPPKHQVVHLVPPEARVPDHRHRRRRARSATARCSTRRRARRVSVPHQADCKSCHTFHGEPGVPQTACLKCHEKVAAEFNPPNAKHADCRSCHQPHTPASAAPAQCRDLPRGQGGHRRAVAAASRRTRRRATSATSSTTSATRRRAPSATPRRRRARRASKHQCQQCHAPHGAPPGTGAAWWQRCSACHAAKVAEREGARARPTRSARTATSRTASPCPTCTSCHKDMGSQGAARRAASTRRAAPRATIRTSSRRRSGSSASPATRTGNHEPEREDLQHLPPLQVSPTRAWAVRHRRKPSAASHRPL